MENWIPMEHNIGNNACNIDATATAPPRTIWSTILNADLGHDIYIVLYTITATLLTIATYNFYVHCQMYYINKKNKSDLAADDNFKDKLLKKMKLSKASKRNNASCCGSIAASLAQMEGGMAASGNFLSAVFAQMWNVVNVAVSNTIKDTLEPTLRELKPVALHFIRLDLGDVPIQTKNMFIHRVDVEHQIAGTGMKEKKAGVQIDVDVVWDGNCDIMLQATLTKGVKVTFGVKQVKLSGRMHILLSPLIMDMPVISAVQYGFTNPPHVELAFSGVVHSVTSKLGVVKSALLGVIQSTLSDVLVLPNRMVMPIDLGTYDYLDTYEPPVGMVRITALNGRGFKVLQKILLKDIPDVYCKISLGASKPFKTSTQYDNVNPSWKDESCDFILYDMDQKVYVKVFDEDKTPMDPDDPLGDAEISVRDLFRNDGVMEIELILDGERTGCFVTLQAELFHLSDQIQSLSSLKYEGKHQLCGLATIIVTKAFDIPIPREDAATYIKCVYGEGSEHEKTFYTGTVVDYPGIDALNPMYDSVFHVPISSAMLQVNHSLPGSVTSPISGSGNNPGSSNNSGIAKNLRHSLTDSIRIPTTDGHKKCNLNRNNITFTLMDTDGANGTRGHGELGKMTITHESLLRAYKHTITETRPIGDRGAKLEFRIIMNGLVTEEETMRRMSQNPQANDDPFAPTAPDSLYGGVEVNDGVPIRITAVRGRGFHIRKRRLQKNDVPDVYCNIHLNTSREETTTCWKTRTIKDDTMPQWNESRDFNNIDPARDLIRVDVFDENKSKDDYLGSAEFSVEKLLRKRMMEVELVHDSTPTKTFIALRAIHLVTTEARPNETGDNACHSNNTAGDSDEEEDDDIVAPLSSAPPSLHSAHIYDSGNGTDGDNVSVTSLNSTSSTSSKKKLGKAISRLKMSKRLMGKSKKKVNNGE